MSIFTYGYIYLTCVFLQDKSQVKVKQLYLSLQEKFTASSHTHTHNKIKTRTPAHPKKEKTKQFNNKSRLLRSSHFHHRFLKSENFMDLSVCLSSVRECHPQTEFLPKNVARWSIICLPFMIIQNLHSHHEIIHPHCSCRRINIIIYCTSTYPVLAGCLQANHQISSSPRANAHPRDDRWEEKSTGPIVY